MKLSPVLVTFALAAFAFSCPASEHAAKLIAGASDIPQRTVSGLPFDLTPTFELAAKRVRAGNATEVLPAYSDWKFLHGKVTSVAGRGFILRKYKDGDWSLSGDYDLVFVRNWPYSGLVDEQYLALFAYPNGTQEYTTVLGAHKTIAAYDFGTEPNAKDRAKLEASAKERAEEKKKEEAIARDKRIEAYNQQSAAAAAHQKEVDAKTLAFVTEKAKEGNATYQLRLGLKYLNADGVARDIAQARRWLRAAAASGEEEAARLLQTLEQTNTIATAKQ